MHVIVMREQEELLISLQQVAHMLSNCLSLQQRHEVGLHDSSTSSSHDSNVQSVRAKVKLSVPSRAVSSNNQIMTCLNHTVHLRTQNAHVKDIAPQS